MKRENDKPIDLKSSYKYNNIGDILLICLSVLAVLFILWTFTGQWFFKSQPYNTYILQVQSWLDGRLDLGKNYEYLELAIYNDKYFVSFPPFPSYVMLPFVALGWETCDGTVALAASLLGAVYAYKIMCHFDIKRNIAVFFALFLTIGSNWLMTGQNTWVWFIAQNMAFTLCLMAIYYALKNKAGLSLLFWACAVGCRPFQILYIPILLYLVYKAHKKQNPDDTIADMIKKRITAFIPMAAVAGSYMVLNFARFGSIFEFGHNYLPEFMRSKNGQFSLSYIKDNIASLVALPEIDDGIWQYPSSNGMCMFMVSPIIISYIIYIARSFIKREKRDMKFLIICVSAVVLELIAITAHKTMGGAHFGNRYVNDILPAVFVSLAVLLPHDDKWMKFNYPLFLVGFTLNIIGTAIYFIE